MNINFLLKLISELLKSDKPTPEEIKCAKKIVDGLIEDLKPNPVNGAIYSKITQQPQYNLENNPTYLDPEAQKAREDLLK